MISKYILSFHLSPWKADVAKLYAYNECEHSVQWWLPGLTSGQRGDRGYSTRLTIAKTWYSRSRMFWQVSTRTMTMTLGRPWRRSPISSIWERVAGWPQQLDGTKWKIHSSCISVKCIFFAYFNFPVLVRIELVFRNMSSASPLLPSIQKLLRIGL